MKKFGGPVGPLGTLRKAKSLSPYEYLVSLIVSSSIVACAYANTI